MKQPDDLEEMLICQEYRLCCRGQWGEHSMVMKGRTRQGHAVKNPSLSSCSCLITAAFVWLLIGAGCSSTPPTAYRPDIDNDSYWNGDRMSGRPSVRISLARQRAYFYKDGQLAGV